MRWSKFAQIGVLIIILITGWYLRSANIQQARSWPDEMDTIRLVEYERIENAITDHGQPLLYYYILSKIKNLINGLGAVSTHEEVYRYFSIVASWLTIILSYFLGKLIFKSNKYGLLLALVVSGNYLQLYYAQEIRMYSLLTLMSFLSLIFYWKIVEAKGKTKWKALLLVNLILVNVHTLGLLLIAIELINLLLIKLIKRKKILIEELVSLLTPLAFFMIAYGRLIGGPGSNSPISLSLTKLLTPIDAATDLWTQVRLFRHLTGIETGRLAAIFTVFLLLMGLLKKQSRKMAILVMFSYGLMVTAIQFLISTGMLEYFATRHFIFMTPISTLIPVLIPYSFSGKKTKLHKPFNRIFTTENVLYFLVIMYFLKLAVEYVIQSPVHYDQIP